MVACADASDPPQDLRNRLFRRLHREQRSGAFFQRLLLSQPGWRRRAIIRCPDARLGRACVLSVSRSARAKRRMMVLNMGSCTVAAASLADSHLTSRCRCSGHCLLWLRTFRVKTCTLHTTMSPFLSCFWYANAPTGRLPTTPITPASSKASRAADR
jgi:hypothetical protein